MEQKKATFKDLPKNTQIFFVIVAIVLATIVIIGSIRQADEESELEASSITIIDRHFKQFDHVRFWACEVSSLDTVQLIEYATKYNVKAPYVDYYLFSTPEKSTIWLEKFNTINEINSAIYTSRPDVIVNVLNGDAMVMEPEYFKPY